MADLRAPTPSAAAELIVPDIVDLRRQIDNCARAVGRELLNRMRDAQQRLDHARETLRRCLDHKIDNYKRGLLHLAAALQARSPARELMLRRNRLGRSSPTASRIADAHFGKCASSFRETEGILRVLGPEATLRRGYSITTDERGTLVRTVASVRPEMKIRTRVSDGEFGSTVTTAR